MTTFVIHNLGSAILDYDPCQGGAPKSDDAYGATVAKRRLSRRLAEIRKANGHTANQICDMLDWGRGKAGRMEANQWKRPEMSDIRDLLRAYGVSAAEAEELEQLASQGRGGP